MKISGFLFAACLLIVAPLTARAAETTDDRLARIEAKMLTREEFKLFVESQNSRFESINQRIEFMRTSRYP